MKTINYFLLVFGLLVATIGKAQTLNDFNRSHSYQLTYDNDFNPTLHLTVKNISNKTITSIEVLIDFGHDPYNWRAPIAKKIARVTIYPGNSGTVSIRIPKEATGFSISKVRYSDGTICDQYERNSRYY